MKQFCIATLTLLASIAAQAGTVNIANAWARATVPGQEVGAAYLDIKSASNATVVKVESPAADFMEMHKMSVKEGKMEMRMLDSLPLPAGQVVKLEPGGLHLMLVGLKKPLKTGEKIGLTLHVKDDKGKVSPVQVEAVVKTGRD